MATKWILILSVSTENLNARNDPGVGHKDSNCVDAQTHARINNQYLRQWRSATEENAFGGACGAWS